MQNLDPRWLAELVGLVLIVVAVWLAAGPVPGLGLAGILTALEANLAHPVRKRRR